MGSEIPTPVGPYSPFVAVDGWVYVSGQTAIDPASGRLLVGDMAAQTRLALKNLKAVLSAAGCAVQDVVKVTAFLTDIQDFAAMNQEYAQFFNAHLPARSTVAVRGLPLEAQVEIEAVARLRSSGSTE
ncbi:Reactive intermediate/imine deaminase [Deinococcus saxicola]|uniref:RidA family protein n=1 Tax=Deinococcus saxicola TaxID=249406 RepID=UPI0039EFDFB9